MVDSRRDDLIRLCQELVRHVSPSGHEENIARFLRSVMVSLGYDSVVQDGYGSILGTVDFGLPGPTLLLEAQMDHAETGDPGNWLQYPFGGHMERGRIYGRGSSDQKGILSAMVMAGAWLKQDMPRGLGGKLVVAAMVHQETFERAASRLVAERVRPDSVISGEPSELTVEVGQRGRASLVVETSGRMEHSSMGERSSAELMVDLVGRIKKAYRPADDPFFGPGALTLTGLYSYPQDARTTMPVRCRATFDRRILPGETAEGVLEELRAMVSEAKKEIKDLEARVFPGGGDGRCYTGAMISSQGFAPAWRMDGDHPFVRDVLEGIAQAGVPPVVSDRSGFGTNGCVYGGDMAIPTVVFGPSRRELAHIVDEYIETDQLVMGCNCYYSVIKKILTPKEEVGYGKTHGA